MYAFKFKSDFNQSFNFIYFRFTTFLNFNFYRKVLHNELFLTKTISLRIKIHIYFLSDNI